MVWHNESITLPVCTPKEWAMCILIGVIIVALLGVFQMYMAKGDR